MQLDRFAPFVAVEPPGEGEPVRAGVRRMPRAELLPVREPDPSLAVDADLRVREARRLLVQQVLIAPVRRLREWNIGRGKLGRGPHELPVHNADDADRAARVE